DKTTFIDAVTLSSGIVVPPATTTLVSSSNPARVNRNVTLSATVTGSNPTGVVKFTMGGSVITGCGSLAVSGSGNSKVAKCTTTFATGGTYGIVATYGGDTNNGSATSPALSQVVKARSR